MKKPVALILALVLVSSFMVMAQAQESPFTMEASVSGVALSSDYLGAYDEVGVATGLSGRLTLEDAITFRGSIAESSVRTYNYDWIRFDQKDVVSQVAIYPDFTLYQDGNVEWSLRAPGAVFGQKTVRTKITEKWYDRTHIERRTQGFSGVGAELGFEMQHFNSYLGVQKLWHESRGNSTADTLVFAGLGYEF